MQNYLGSLIIVMVFATSITRLAPMCLPKKYYESLFLKELNSFFPAIIITLLVIYSIKDANWNLLDISTSRFAWAELAGTIISAVVHFYKRNALLSIGIGTLVYVVVKHFSS
jgi:branched-subunit amino acid transport protein AzlD